MRPRNKLARKISGTRKRYLTPFSSSFLMELLQIVDVGYAIDCAEGMKGVRCVAADCS